MTTVSLKSVFQVSKKNEKVFAYLQQIVRFYEMICEADFHEFGTISRWNDNSCLAWNSSLL